MTNADHLVDSPAAGLLLGLTEMRRLFPEPGEVDPAGTVTARGYA